MLEHLETLGQQFLSEKTWGRAALVILLLYIFKVLCFQNVRKKHKDVSLRGFEWADNSGSTEKAALVNEIRKRKRAAGKFPPTPNGWFGVMESDQLKKGEAKDAVICDKEVVVWRGQNGVAYVADAYCPHLGAHLGVEGEVKGNCIQCPFHNWQFDGSQAGKLTCIPYSEKTIENVRLKMWRSMEVNGFIWIWHHADGEPPSWEPVENPATRTGHLSCSLDTYINCHMQELYENAADKTHLLPVHSSFFGNGRSLLDKPVPLQMLAHVDWDINWKAELEDPKKSHEATATIKSKLLLFNLVKLVDFDTIAQQFGPGIFVTSYCSPMGKIVVVSAATPVSPLLVRIRQRFYCSNFLLKYASSILEYGHVTQFARDVMIWNRKIYREFPPLPKEDNAIKIFRRYYSQFYSKAKE